MNEKRFLIPLGAAVAALLPLKVQGTVNTSEIQSLPDDAVRSLPTAKPTESDPVIQKLTYAVRNAYTPASPIKYRYRLCRTRITWVAWISRFPRISSFWVLDAELEFLASAHETLSSPSRYRRCRPPCPSSRFSIRSFSWRATR